MTPAVASRILGLCLWSAAIGLLWWSGWTVHARASRPQVVLRIRTVQPHALKPGDAVYAFQSQGLVRIGEVQGHAGGQQPVNIAVRPEAAAMLNAGTTAVCWRTPLTVEQAFGALLPPTIQNDIVDLVTRDWEERQDELLAAWRPIGAELASAFIQIVAEDLEAALSLREDEMLQAASGAAQTFQKHWPAIQRRLGPIMQKHLTPILSRLMDDALDQAPKTRIAWHLYRNNSTEAFNLLLDWQARYLAELSDHDKRELTAALHSTWAAAARDEVLVHRFKLVGHDLQRDPRITGLITDVFREAVADNPRTSAFLKDRIIESPRIKQELYRAIEWFAPTARRVAKMCLFDDRQRTRPEIVQLLRSIALRREVSWVTLTTRGAAPPLPPDAVLGAEVCGGTSQGDWPAIEP